MTKSTTKQGRRKAASGLHPSRTETSPSRCALAVSVRQAIGCRASLFA